MTDKEIIEQARRSRAKREARKKRVALRKAGIRELKRNKRHRQRARKHNVAIGYKLSLTILIEMQEGKCIGHDIWHRCEQTNGDKVIWTVDHIVPLSRGGPDMWHNTQAMCHTCNTSKNDRTMAEWLDWIAERDRRHERGRNG